jgi:hypothetical protein
MMQWPRLAMHIRWLGCMAAWPCAAALSQPLTDPTRPPAQALTAATGVQGSTAAAQGLQLVISGPGRQLVLYDGRLLRQGETVQGATLLKTRQDQAAIRKEGERLRLSAHPLVQKTVRHSHSRPPL